MERVDGVERKTYTLEGSETADGEERTLLKIRTEEISTGESKTDQYFLMVGTEAIQLHRTVIEDEVATLAADFPTPVTFFPLQLELGDKWQIAADAEAELVGGITIPGESVTDLEVVGFEDVATPAGTFQSCAKVQLDLRLTASGGFIKGLNISPTTYQWFAPDIGPVQYENSDGLLFGLVSSNLLTEPEEPDPTEEDVLTDPSPEVAVIPEPAPEEVIPDPSPEVAVIPEPTTEENVTPEPPPYDVTGDGIVNILDLTFVASRFGESDTDADVTGDGIVNILDLVLIAQNLGN